MNVPSGYTALDMIGFTDQGVYNSATAYVKNDIVHYNGNLWRCLVDDTTAVTPTEGANWTVFLAEPTSAAEDIIAPVESTATSTRIYSVGDQLILGDVLYDVKQAINVGDTLTVGTNIAAADTIVKQLAEKAESADLAAVATSGEYSDLNNLPTLGTAAAKNVPSSGDASTTEVVMGNDTRLTNARNAADVSAWAKAANKPTYNGSEISTSTAKTGTAQQSITDTVASGTSMDNVVGTMLDNDKTLDTNITSLKETLTNNGAHNLFDVGNSIDDWFLASNNGLTISDKPGSDRITATVNSSTNSVTVTAYNNAGYFWGCKRIELKKNTDYKFSWASASGTFQLFGKNNSSTNAVSIGGFSSGTLNSGNYDWWYIGFYPSTSGGYFSVSNFLVRLGSDTDTTYTPYAKTNQELTKDDIALTDNVKYNGCKNRWNIDDCHTMDVNQGGSHTYNEGIITVTCVNQLNSGAYLTRISLRSYFSDLNGIPIILSFKVKGDSSFTAMIGANSDKKNVVLTTSYQTIEIPFSGAENIDSIVFYSNAAHTITITDFMCRLATDEDSTYVSYAKSNKQLTDDVSNKYLLTGSFQITVTADGVKTYQALMLDLFAALKADAIAHPDDYYRINFLGMGNYMLRSNANGQRLMRGSGGIYTMRFDSVSLSSGHYFMFYAETSPAVLTSNRYFTVDNGTVTVQNSVVPTSGTTLIVYYDVYKLV